MDSNKKYWKGLEELQQTPAFVEKSKGEFAEPIPVEDVLNEAGLSTKTPRRDFLKALGFGLGAVTLAACNRTPVHKAVPYVIKPEEITPGIPNYYASSFNGQSVLIRTREGRPILVEANPNAVGLVQGTESATVSSVLDLYDMTNKLQNPQIAGKDVEWSKLDTTVKQALVKASNSGKQITLVSRTVNSPSTLQAIAKFKESFPTTNLVQFDPISYSGIRKANEQSFGRAVIPAYDFEKALVVLSVGADFLGTWLDGEEHTQDYIKNRNYKSLEGGKMSRHIQFEAGMSMTGTNADVRIAVKPSEEGAVLVSLYNEITGSSLPGALAGNQRAATAIKLAAQELLKNKGQAVVVAGANNVDIQILANAINVAIGAYGTVIDLDNFSKKYQGSEEAFTTFLADASAGKVGAVMFLNANPLYDYADAKVVKDALAKIDFTLSFADRADETASELNAIAPTSNYLESWGDESSREGYYTIVQPTINPVFNTRQAEQSLLVWSGNIVNIFDFVKNVWETQILAGSAKKWKDVLQTGFEYKGKLAAKAYAFTGNVQGAAANIQTYAKSLAGEGFELALYESAAIRDGRFANNAFLQELPDPVSKVTWDNYLALNPKDIEALGLGENSVVAVEGNNYTVELPVLAQPGQALGTASVAVGYGRTKVGKAGNNVGINAYPFATVKNGVTQTTAKVKLSKVSRTYELAQTQTHHTIEGRNIIRETTFAKYLKNPASESGRFADSHKSYDLWNKFESPGHKWVMAIDLNACTGCGACIVACNIENNIPVVGRDEVRRRREMHWMRIDRYYTIEEDGVDYTKEDDIANLNDFQNVKVVHQPMMCQHCEHAPCETVCPVLATVHSSEGLNHMAYNRCFGTRYCANNCPYKVRRFNWFNYWNDSRFDNYLNNEFTQLVLNPDVTTRSRGVMEKCSMCIQRIQAGKLQAKIEGRPLKDGDIKLACSGVCSANAMIFGDANDPNSEVSKALRSERIYYVLEEINVQPNIGYMTKVRNSFEA